MPLTLSSSPNAVALALIEKLSPLAATIDYPIDLKCSPALPRLG